MAVFTGRRSQGAEGKTSAHHLDKVLEQRNKTYETCFLDSSDPKNAAGRYVNDTCSGYIDREYRDNPYLSPPGYSPTEHDVKVPPDFRNNVRYRQHIKKHLTIESGISYLEIYALFDIDKHE